METTELKSNLFELMNKVQDQRFLQAVMDLVSIHLQMAVQKENDWYDELPEHVKQDIEEGIAQADRGECIPHEEVMKRIKEEYNIAI